jgi:hypothetical protein
VSLKRKGVFDQMITALLNLIYIVVFVWGAYNIAKDTIARLKRAKDQLKG